jgi:hypothetical protein
MPSRSIARGMLLGGQSILFYMGGGVLVLEGSDEVRLRDAGMGDSYSTNHLGRDEGQPTWLRV